MQRLSATSEALGILVIAVGLGRIPLGLALIVCFSMGLAAVLIGIGIALVRARIVLERLAGRASGLTSRTVPLASAAVVTTLGAGIAASVLLRSLG